MMILSDSPVSTTGFEPLATVLTLYLTGKKFVVLWARGHSAPGCGVPAAQLKGRMQRWR